MTIKMKRSERGSMKRSALHVFALGALVAVTACGGRIDEHADDGLADTGSPTSDPEATVSTPDPPSVARPNPLVAGSVWRGSYTCRQGLTDLELRIVAVNGNAIEDALFDFNYASKASGSFHLSGQFEPESSRVIFKDGAWVAQPGRSWETVGMDGTVDATGTIYEGQIVAGGCGTFRVTRVG
jgi:hypothetical protein